MQKTNIGWCSHTANPIIGRHHETGKRGWVCTRISDGCTACYAEELNLRLGTRLPYNRASEDVVTWELYEPELQKLRTHRGPATIFLGSMTDIWHERVPDQWIDMILLAATLNPRHRVMTLTKRAERLPDYFHPFRVPAPNNLFVGVTVENRATMGRIDLLKQSRVAKRFLSCEPLLEDLGEMDVRGIDLVIIGGETGAKARPMEIAWVQSIVTQAQGAGCQLFVKQDRGRYPGQQGRLPDDLWALKAFPTA